MLGNMAIKLKVGFKIIYKTFYKVNDIKRICSMG